MKIPQLQRSSQPAGFTLVELLCVMAIIGILAAFLLPSLSVGKERAKRMVCVNNERQLGLAFQMFSHDHEGKFPMQVSMSEGGSREFVENGLALGGEFYFSYRHFQVLSNQSVQSQELVCPADTRAAASSLSRLKNNNLSYFIGVNADFNRSDSILAGDRNITRDTSRNPTIELLERGSLMRWTEQLHRYKGDVLFGDGHVEQWNKLKLAANVRTLNTNAIFFLPSVKLVPILVGDNYNRSGASAQPASESGGGGGQSTTPAPAPRAGGGTTPAPSPTGVHPPDTQPARPAGTVTPLPGVTMDANDFGSENAAVPDPTDGASQYGRTHHGFQAFITSGWWFWLFLLLLLAVLAEIWRRLYQAKS